MKITAKSFEVTVNDDSVHLRRGETTAEIQRPADDVLVYSALDFKEAVVVRRNQLFIEDQRFDIGPVPAEGADKMLLDGFATMLENAATQLRIASSNKDKLREFREALTPLGVDVAAPDNLDLDVIEDGQSYEDNALKKARAWAAMTGHTTVADDSGIAIDALGGAPGIYSSRYSGVTGAGRFAANNKKILDNLGDTPAEQRSATISTVLAYQVPGEEPVLFRGDVKGSIAFEPRGDNGWATDVLFIPDGQDKTVAEMTDPEKVQYNPRKIALQKLLDYLEAQGDDAPAGQIKEV